MAKEIKKNRPKKKKSVKEAPIQKIEKENRKRQDKITDATVTFMKFAPTIITMIIASVVCFMIVIKLKDALGIWNDTATGYVPLWAFYLAVGVVWGGYMLFSIARLIKKLKY